MRPLRQFPTTAAARIRAVFTDIDDTLTTDGRLTGAAYGALERLDAAGIAVVPVTGRPAGWCDMIARFWPVAGVVGENGAFYFSHDRATRRMRRQYFAPAAQRHAFAEKLAHVRNRVLSEVPGSALSADQPFRETDLAIDFCEDVAPLGPGDVARIRQIFEEEGATAKISSIHVNGWYGDYDKLSMSLRLAREVLCLDEDACRATSAYCGDSPNDSPMFAWFEHSFGVANIADFAGELEHRPKWVAPSRGGAGFVEIAQAFLRART